jgi:mycothiol synthase
VTSPGISSAPPTGYRLRRPTADDAPAVADLKRAVDVARHGDSDVTPAEIVEEWALPRLAPDEDLWLVETPSHELAGYALVWMEDPPNVFVAEQTVHPDHRGRGLSEFLLELSESRAARAAGRGAGGAPANLGVWTHDDDAARRALYVRHGFRYARTFLHLAVDLGEPPAAAVWPPGIAVGRFRRNRDEAAVHAAGEEAFQDHWRPDSMDLDEWLSFRFERPDLDLDLWWVAWDGEEVAGSLLAFETPLGGYVDSLFVRRPWRGRGLGRALLLEAFAELRRRGLPQAYLGVDSENPTGAMGLYESVGMTPERGAHLVFEKVLPGG